MCSYALFVLYISLFWYRTDTRLEQCFLRYLDIIAEDPEKWSVISTPSIACVNKGNPLFYYLLINKVAKLCKICADKRLHFGEMNGMWQKFNKAENSVSYSYK